MVLLSSFRGLCWSVQVVWSKVHWKAESVPIPRDLSDARITDLAMRSSNDSEWERVVKPLTEMDPKEAL